MSPKKFIEELVTFRNRLSEGPDKHGLSVLIVGMMSGVFSPVDAIRLIQEQIDGTRKPTYPTPTRRISSTKIWEEVREIFKNYLKDSD